MTQRPLVVGGYGVALASYTGSSESELTFREGDLIKFLGDLQDGWGKGELAGTIAWFPLTYVEARAMPPQAPPKPRPPPPGTTATTSNSSSSSGGGSGGGGSSSLDPVLRSSSATKAAATSTSPPASASASPASASPPTSATASPSLTTKSASSPTSPVARTTKPSLAALPAPPRSASTSPPPAPAVPAAPPTRTIAANSNSLNRTLLPGAGSLLASVPPPICGNSLGEVKRMPHARCAPGSASSATNSAAAAAAASGGTEASTAPEAPLTRKARLPISQSQPIPRGLLATQSESSGLVQQPLQAPASPTLHAQTPSTSASAPVVAVRPRAPTLKQLPPIPNLPPAPLPAVTQLHNAADGIRLRSSSDISTTAAQTLPPARSASGTTAGLRPAPPPRPTKPTGVSASTSSLLHSAHSSPPSIPSSLSSSSLTKSAPDGATAQLLRIPPRPVRPSGGHDRTESIDSTAAATATSATDEEEDEDDSNMSILAAKERTSLLLDSWLPIRARPDEVFDPNVRTKKTTLRAKLFKKPRGVFGIPLAALQEGRQIPIIVMQCVGFLSKPDKLRIEGLFRVSGNKDMVEKLKLEYKNPNHTVDMAKFKNAHVIATMLKQFFRDLPEPIFPFDFYDATLKTYHELQDVPYRISVYQQLITRMPQSSLDVVRFLFKFLRLVAENSDANHMTPINLGIVFGPTLLKPREIDPLRLMTQETCGVVQFLIEEYYSIFEKRAAPS